MSTYPDVIDLLTTTRLNDQRVDPTDYTKPATIINALQLKVGSGSSVPQSGWFLAGLANGASIWRKLQASDLPITTPTGYIEAGSYGAAGLGKIVNDGAITTGTATLTSATAAFVSADAGKIIVVNGAGAAGAPLVTTIASFTNATTVVLTANASTTVSGAKVVFGVDEATALSNAITAGGKVNISAGIYLMGSGKTVGSGKFIQGAGKDLTTLIAVASFSQVFSFASSSSGVIVTDLTLDGDLLSTFVLNINGTCTNLTFIRCRIKGGTSRNFSESSGCTNIRFIDCEFTDPGLAAAANCFASGGTTFTNCKWIHTNGATCRQLHIDGPDCRTSNCEYDGGDTSLSGVYVSNTTGSHRTEVLNNKFRALAKTEGAAAILVLQPGAAVIARQFDIVGNEFENCGLSSPTVAVGGCIGFGAGTATAYCQDITIVGNNARNIGDFAFIGVYNRNATIAGNEASGLIGSVAGAGNNTHGQFSECDGFNCVISGNTCDGAVGVFVSIWPASGVSQNLFSRVTGNTFTNILQRADGSAPAGIAVHASEVEINDNTINSSVTGISGSVGLYMHTSTSNPNVNISRIRFLNNRVSGFDKGASLDRDGSLTITNGEIRGNDFTGCTTPMGANLTSHTNFWNSAKIKDNVGYNPVGPSAITVTASPFTYTAGPSPEEVYIYGGTVSDISKGGVQIATASPSRVHLEPQQAVIVTYSAAPTMKKDVA